jgi:hypothetical protein
MRWKELEWATVTATCAFTLSMAILLALALTIAHATPAAAQEEPTKEELRAGLRRVEQTRYVRGGKQLNLGSLTAINPNCTVLESDNTITKEPEHGTATIDVSEHFPNFSKGNIRAKCNDKKLRCPLVQGGHRIRRN